MITEYGHEILDDNELLVHSYTVGNIREVRDEIKKMSPNSKEDFIIKLYDDIQETSTCPRDDTKLMIKRLLL